MKIKRLLLPTVPIALITLSSFASAESFSYRHPLEGVLSQSNSSTEENVEEVVEDFSDSSCYDPENLNTIGTEAPCEGMLIVSDSQIREGAESQKYYVNYSGKNYTFGDSEYNIFTGQLEDMSDLFYRHISFNENIGYWDTSNATTMSRMFYNTSFNQYIGDWNTSKVKDMSYMFYHTPFNQYIGDWDTSNVTTLQGTFYSAIDFDQDISKWDISNVEKLFYTFNDAINFNQDISQWNTAKVTSMTGTFHNAVKFNQDIGGWNTSNTTDMSYMFRNTATFNQDIGDWNTSKVKSIAYMFNNAKLFNQDISQWDVSLMSNSGMWSLFKDASSFNYDLDSWCVSKIESIPVDFRDNALRSWRSPVWGTCP